MSRNGFSFSYFAKHLGHFHQHPRLLRVRAIFREHQVIGKINAHVKRLAVFSEQQKTNLRTGASRLAPLRSPKAKVFYVIGIEEAGIRQSFGKK
jgi:hypothetical protein